MSGENDVGNVMESRIVYSSKKKVVITWTECSRAYRVGRHERQSCRQEEEGWQRPMIGAAR